MPIISGEWGYSTFTNKGVSLETQAAYAVRQQLGNLLAGVPISIWYDWKNDGPDLSELSGYRVAKRLSTGSTNDFVLLLQNGGARKLAAWTSGEPHQVEVQSEFKEVRGITSAGGDGGAGEAEWKDGRLSIGLKSMPQYISLN